LLDKTSSWLYPGKIEMKSDSSVFVENDYYQRALIFNNVKKDRKCDFTLDPESRNSVVVNPVFIINGWSGNSISVKAGDKLLEEGIDFRSAVIGNKALVWVRMKFDKPIIFNISAVERNTEDKKTD